MGMLRVAAAAALMCSSTWIGVSGTDVGAFTVLGPTIASGTGHTVVVGSDGTVSAFGLNNFGQLGTTTNSGTTTANPTPTQVPGLSRVTEIAAGGYHTVTLRTDGSVWTFGANSLGQLGTTTNSGTATANPTPTQVPGLSGVVAVAGGVFHTVALRSDGTVWTFGYNRFGQLGTSTNNGTGVANPTPTQVPDLSGVTAIAAGGYHTMALRSDGTVWTFGDNSVGQLGTSTNNGTGVANPTPTMVPGLSGVTAVAGGDEFSIALRTDGTVWTFGYNNDGQLGTATNSGTNTPNPTAAQVPGVSGARAIAAGAYHTIVLRSDGSVLAFGDNVRGQLGLTTNIGVNVANPTPALVPGLTGVAAIAAGGSSTLALGDDGRVRSFGHNLYGQLGTVVNSGTGNANPTPVSITTAADPVAASRFVAVNPTRVLDTRPASAINFSGAKPGPGSSTVVTVVGTAGVPADATAISANLTTTEATAAGFVQAFPTGTGTPGSSSNVNVERLEQTIANAITVPIGDNGTITIFSQSGGHLLLDITGYFIPATGPTSGGRLIPVTPTRLLDTRPASVINHTGVKPGAGSITRVQVAGLAPVPSADVAAVVLTVTATEATAAGYVQLGPASVLSPGASSNLNIEYAGQTLPNQAIVPLGLGGAIEIFTQSGSHLLVDVTAYVTADGATPGTDGLFVPISPTRVLDTRPASAVGSLGGLPGPGSTTRVDAAVITGIPVAGVAAIVANVTLTEATGPGFVQAAGAGTLVPGASSILNANNVGQTIPDAALIPVIDGRFDLFTQTGGHLIADVFGYYTN